MTEERPGEGDGTDDLGSGSGGDGGDRPARQASEDSDRPAAPRRRMHRRAYGGTAPRDPGAGGHAHPAAGPEVDSPPASQPRTTRAPDDTDVGWGDRPDPDDDERFLREVPPHW